MDDTEILDKTFDALANSRRRNIISALALQPLTISKLAQFEDLSLPAIHKHIKFLESADLILRKKVGRSNFLVLNTQSLYFVQNWVSSHHSYWGSTQATLENYASAHEQAFSLDPKNLGGQEKD